MANSSLTLSFLSSIFAAVAFFLSWSSAFSCNYVQFTTIQDSTLSLGFGMWSHNWYAISKSLGGSVVFQFCIGYGSIAIDSAMKSARVFSILALVLGGTFFFYNLISGCAYPSNKRTNNTRCEGIAYLLTCLFQGLSLLLLNSPTVCTNNPLITQLQSEVEEAKNIEIDFNETCTISTGARCCIAAIVFWFLAAVTSCQATSVGRNEEESEKNLTDPLINGDIL